MEFIPEFKLRVYQQTILSSCVDKNTLVVLPTGLGKTAIAMALVKFRLDLHPNHKILFLAPTKPLVDQHKTSFFKYFSDLNETDVVVFNGSIKPQKRAELWNSSKVIITTPQTAENDIVSGRINLEDVSLLVVDEAHKAVGNYAYTFVADMYHKKASFERILALTASPGSNLDSIHEVISNLFITNVEYRSKDSFDVKPYVKDIILNWLEVDLGKNLLKISSELYACLNVKLEKVKVLGFIDGSIKSVSKTKLLALQRQLMTMYRTGELDVEDLKVVSLITEALKVYHAISLIETQTVGACYKYMDSIVKDSFVTKTKAVKNLVSDVNFLRAFKMIKYLYSKNYIHPKLLRLKSLFDDGLLKGDSKVIIFTQFRDSAEEIKELLSSNLKCELFFGQNKSKSSSKGMSQKVQKEIIDRFRKGEFQCLIATSVAEEGLDIPSVDHVIFYEPIPSGIRTVQRRGRTGRGEKGNVYVLVALNTFDDVSRHVARYKEKNMYKLLDRLKLPSVSDKDSFVNSFEKSTKSLFDFDDSLSSEFKSSGEISGGSKLDFEIYVDYREKSNGLIKKFLMNDVKVNMVKLDIGDYVLDKDIVVEFKTVSDFVDSILDRRLMTQARELNSYKFPFILVEGSESIFSMRNINPSAVMGFISSLYLDFGINVFFSSSLEESFLFMMSLIRRFQKKGKTYFNLHASKPMGLSESMEYVVSSIPNVGPTLSKSLLNKFGSVKGVFNASLVDLESIERLGNKKAKFIYDFVNSKYRL